MVCRLCPFCKRLRGMAQHAARCGLAPRSAGACMQQTQLSGSDRARDGTQASQQRGAGTCAREAALQGARAGVLARDVVAVVRPDPLEPGLHLKVFTSTT